MPVVDGAALRSAARASDFHQHLTVRHRGTPADVAWHEVDEWGRAPSGDEDDIAALSTRLRARIQADG